ncbi:MAG TPA: hypothetical protein VMU84_01645 [Thermoanaerobaculia bacterium]|nr:hypothetical protein [Thermoanaerobaculia bacterium]
MQEAEFQRALIVAIVAGTIIAGVGATALFFAFRAFGRGKRAPLIILGALIVFIFASCLGLFLWAMRG